MKVDLINYGPHHIDVIVLDQVGIKWRSTFVYGEPRLSDRPKFWKLIKRIKSQSSEPWLMCGDFNEALFQSEHASPQGEETRARCWLSGRLWIFATSMIWGFLGCPGPITTNNREPKTFV
jgi:hypothetical protein